MNAVMYILLASPNTTPMSAGKAAAQAAHAAVEAYRLTDPDSNLHADWYVANHYTKIVLQAPDGPQGLNVAKAYLEDRGVKTALIIDEGRTEFDNVLTPTALGCALVNKDNPHIQATFDVFKLYGWKPKQQAPSYEVYNTGKKPLRCKFGLHGERGYRADKFWCLRCGKTWEDAYDGVSPFSRVRHDLNYGQPAKVPRTLRRPDPTQKQGY
jgi:peptidyl-tRNA hydrolase